jgi:hypothetical protein
MQTSKKLALKELISHPGKIDMIPLNDDLRKEIIEAIRDNSDDYSWFIVSSECNNRFVFSKSIKN